MRAGEVPALCHSSRDRPCRRLLPKRDDKAAGSSLASRGAAERSGSPCLALPDAEPLAWAYRPCRRVAACLRPSARLDAVPCRPAEASSVSPSVPVVASRDGAPSSAPQRVLPSSPAFSPERLSWRLPSFLLPVFWQPFFSLAPCAWQISLLPVSSRLSAWLVFSLRLSALLSSWRRALPRRFCPNPSSCSLYVSSQSLS